MKIGIDVSQLAYPGSGVARYTRMMLDALINNDEKNQYILFFTSLRQAFPQDLLEKLPPNFTLKRFFIPPTLLSIIWNNLHILPIEMFIGEVDIFFTSDWTEPPSSKAKKITTIHDLVVHVRPETSHPRIIATQKSRLNWVVKESEIIMCDSKSTQKDLQKIYQVQSKNLKVVYPPVEIEAPKKHDVKRVMEKYSLHKHYILCVGKLEPRKNIPLLVSAFEKADIKDVELLVVGPFGWESKNLIKKHSSKTVRFLGYVPDEDLYPLYDNALFFICPSLYEGFGYPIVEAMVLGTPVAASETSSLGEIVGNDGLLFDPTSERDIISTIETMASDKSIRESFSKRGLKRADEFTEKNFANQLLHIFQNVHENRN